MKRATIDAIDTKNTNFVFLGIAPCPLPSSSLVLPFPFMASANYTTPNGNKCTVCKTQLEVRFAKGGKVPGSHFLYRLQLRTYTHGMHEQDVPKTLCPDWWLWTADHDWVDKVRDNH
ncbi:hypothetical protein B0H14DRAFT_2579850 [Mycena olivaceomarginata]|nr:hypothetical protein B0H14DRAFT_2579850 [Mycena olivaceomarginata]